MSRDSRIEKGHTPPGWWTRLGIKRENQEGQSTPDQPETAGGGC